MEGLNEVFGYGGVFALPEELMGEVVVAPSKRRRRERVARAKFGRNARLRAEIEIDTDDGDGLSSMSVEERLMEQITNEIKERMTIQTTMEELVAGGSNRQPGKEGIDLRLKELEKLLTKGDLYKRP